MDLTVILVILMTGYATGCPKMCSCTLEETVCYFTKCSDPVPLAETYVLKVHGPVCDRQRQILENPSFRNTIKCFYDDVCWNVPNCRYLQVCVCVSMCLCVYLTMCRFQ